MNQGGGFGGNQGGGFGDNMGFMDDNMVSFEHERRINLLDSRAFQY